MSITIARVSRDIVVVMQHRRYGGSLDECGVRLAVAVAPRHRIEERREWMRGWTRMVEVSAGNHDLRTMLHVSSLNQTAL